MLITSALLPSDKYGGLGLADIEMKRLGPVVLIAGQNGSGKTRLFTKIRSALQAAPNAAKKQELSNSLTNLERELASVNEELDKALAAVNMSKIVEIPPGPKTPESEVERLRNRKLKLQRNIAAQKESLEWDHLRFSEEFEGAKVVDFVPKKLELTDSDTLSPKDLEQRASQVNQLGVDQLAGSVFAKIQQITNQYIMSTHPKLECDATEKESNISEYERLQDNVQRFLSTELRFTDKGKATLFGRPLGQTQLSDGQKVLLQFCLALYAQSGSLSDVILLMDEPENHLHPSLLVEVLDRIVQNLDSGQVFIATHSIHVLAHFDPTMIYYMEDGSISYAGNIPEQVLSGLLGSETEIGKLTDFLSLPAQFAALQFAVESLFPPQSVSTGLGDPQTNQIVEILRSTTPGRLRLLDYGAGKGRLLSAFSEHGLLERIDYFAYDKYDTDRQICESIISSHYGSSDGRYCTTLSELLAAIDPGTVNVIVMCNVLHEIAPNEWPAAFNTDSVFSRLFAENGYLLVVEDYQMPKGERAHSNGFLLLDECHLRALFSITHSNHDYRVLENRGGRLKAHYIPQRLLANITDNSRKNALELVKSTAIEEIVRLRSQTPTYVNGKLHALHVHQYTNASLSLRDYESVR